MKRLFFLYALLLAVQLNLFAQCNSGSYTVASNSVIQGSCIIMGDLTILNGATLNVDLTGATADTFVVRGNILLQGNATLWIHAAPNSTNDQFIVSNSYSNHRTITTKGSSHFVLENIEFRTQEGNLTGAASIYMNYYAKDKSIFHINKSWLDRSTAWLLCNLQNKSLLQGLEPDGVPTEIYLLDSAAAALHGPKTDVGMWLNFESITDTLTLPDQTKPFTWAIGRGVGGLSPPWYLEVDNALPGIGVQILPSSNITINGTGQPATGELTVSLLFANNTDTVKNLQVGLQNATIRNGPSGRVTLKNVKLHPVAWQLYALMNEHLFIKNSTINEIGIAGPSTVVVDNSILQLAVLAAVGIGGSTMTINNSEVWNQAITAGNNSNIIFNNCNITGSAFSTTDALSHITVKGGCFFKNPDGCTQATMISIATGQPYCNPFIPPGFPQNLSPLAVTFIGVNNNCVTGIDESSFENTFTVYPNPASETLNIFFPDNKSNEQQIQIFNSIGMLLKENSVSPSSEISIADLSSGLYFIRLKDNPKQTIKFIKN